MARVHEVIAAVAPHDSERYTRLGVEVLAGYAKIIDPGRWILLTRVAPSV